MNKQVKIFLFCSFAVVSSAQSAVYKWTDEQGNSHYSDHPRDVAEPAEAYDVKVGSQSDPEAIASSQKRLDDMRSSNRLIAKERQENKEHKKLKDKEEQQKLEECTYWKKQAKLMQVNARIFELNDAGEQIHINNAERLNKLAEAKGKVKDKCK